MLSIGDFAFKGVIAVINSLTIGSLSLVGILEIIAEVPIGLSLRNIESLETEMTGAFLLGKLLDIEVGNSIIAERAGIEQRKIMRGKIPKIDFLG